MMFDTVRFSGLMKRLERLFPGPPDSWYAEVLLEVAISANGAFFRAIATFRGKRQLLSLLLVAGYGAITQKHAKFIERPDCQRA
jgi:hypothetical protein